MIDALHHLIVAVVSSTKVIRHVVRIVKISDRGGKMRLACKQDVLCTACQVSLVLLGQSRTGKVFQPRVLEYL